MSGRKLTELEKLAYEVAICTPDKQGKYSLTAGIPWSVVNDIRAELSRVGLDWRAGRKEMIRIRDERRAERRGVKADLCGNIKS